MTAKFSASSDGTKVTIGTAAEDALQIDATAKTIKALAPYALINSAPVYFSANAAAQAMGWGVVFGFGSWTVASNVGASTFNTGNGTVTPKIPGYYSVIGNVSFQTDGITDQSSYGRVLKNGLALVTQGGGASGVAGFPVYTPPALVYMNGTTDTLQVVGGKSQSPNATNVTAGIALLLVSRTG